MDKKEGATTGELETPGSLYTVCNWAGIAKEKGRGLVSNKSSCSKSPVPAALHTFEHHPEHVLTFTKFPVPAALHTHLTIALHTCSVVSAQQLHG